MNSKKLFGVHIKHKEFAYLLAALFTSIVLKYFVLSNIPITGISSQSLFITSLIGRYVETPLMLIQIADLGNIVLIWFIAILLLGIRPGKISSFVYAISPISIYSSLSGSGYVVMLFLILLTILGMIIGFDKRHKSGFIMVVIGSVLMAYYSFWGLLFVPTWIVAFYVGRYKQFSAYKTIIISLAALLAPLVFMLLFKPNALVNEYTNNITLFSDPGLINAVNVNRGQADEAGFILLVKFVDNKYTYLGRHLLFNTIDHLSPVIYFTPQLKMLGFSFSPPILLGFLLPLVVGIPLLFRKLSGRRYLLPIWLFLLIPSILSWPSPNSSSILLITPIVVLGTSAGIVRGLSSNNKYLKLMTLLSLVLVVFQLIVILTDISTREYFRFIEYSK